MSNIPEDAICLCNNKCVNCVAKAQALYEALNCSPKTPCRDHKTRPQNKIVGLYLCQRIKARAYQNQLLKEEQLRLDKAQLEAENHIPNPNALLIDENPW